MLVGFRNGDGLEREGLVDCLAERSAGTFLTGLRPVAGLVGERNADWLRGPGHRAWQARQGPQAGPCAQRGGSHRRRRDHDPAGSSFNLRRAGERPTRRHVPLDTAQQCRHIRRDSGRGHKPGRILGRPLVEDSEAGLDGRAVSREHRAVDSRREHHARLLLQPHERAVPGGFLGREPPAGDGDETASPVQTRQGGADVPPSGVGGTGPHMRHGREGRVHDDDRGADCRVEMVVDLRGVVMRDQRRRKQLGEQAGAHWRQFVERKLAALELGEDGEQARAGRGLQHEVAGLDVRRGHHRPAERDRRRELLEDRALLRTPGMRRRQRREPAEQRQHSLRCVSFLDQRWSVAAQEQHGRGLRRLIGELPVPGAAGVGGAEGLGHRGAQDASVEAMPAFEVRKEVLGGREDGAGRVERVSRGSCGGSDGLGGHRVLFDRGIDEPRGGGGGRVHGKGPGETRGQGLDRSLSPPSRPAPSRPRSSSGAPVGRQDADGGASPCTGRL